MPRDRARPETARTEGRPTARRRLPCPTCGEADGFLLTVDGAVYRVLEDDRDTALLEEYAGGTEAFVTCSACKTTMAAAAVLAAAPAEVEFAEDVLVSRPEIRMGPRRNRIHRAGRAAERHTGDGRTLPMCPECGATHDFFIDLDGAAYRVLEDDEDTDLLGEAANLLCARCHAVFEL